MYLSDNALVSITCLNSVNVYGSCINQTNVFRSLHSILRASLSYIANDRAADGLAFLGAKASAVMVLT